jgi:vacuolar-type H+-ATPase subunit F/Vma7
MKIAVIGDRLMVRGFTLAGIKEGTIAESSQNTLAALEHYLSLPDIGIIILWEHLAAEIQPFLMELLDGNRMYPMIVTVPGKVISPYGDAHLKNILHKAVGMEIWDGE